MSTTKATRDVIDLNTRPITNLNCTGGTINGTSVGATTPSTGKFTNITADTITLNANGTLDLSASNVSVLGTIHAYYAADLAEAYISDQEYPAGTLVQIGGAKEITIATSRGLVFGVISSNPATVMNAHVDGGQPVAMVGRVPVRVVGPVSKGQRLILSDIPGVARAASAVDDAVVVGRSLVNSSEDGEHLIEAVVKYSV